MIHFYTSSTESILTSSITIWSAAATAKDKGKLQNNNLFWQEGYWLQPAFFSRPVWIQDPETGNNYICWPLPDRI